MVWPGIRSPPRKTLAYAPGCPRGGKAPDRLRIADPCRERDAGHARRSDLEPHLAQFKNIAKGKVARRHAVNQEVFAHETRRHGFAQIGLPPRPVRFAQQIDRLLGSAVILFVYDLITRNPKSPDPHGRLGRLEMARQAGFRCDGGRNPRRNGDKPVH